MKGMMEMGVENEMNPNDPSLHNKGDNEYSAMGFMNQEDYDRHHRRKQCRKKECGSDMGMI